MCEVGESDQGPVGSGKGFRLHSEGNHRATDEFKYNSDLSRVDSVGHGLEKDNTSK